MLCPNCGYNNQANNRFCVRCGIDISVLPPPETPSFETGQSPPPPPPPPAPAAPPSAPASVPPAASPLPAAPNPWGTPHQQQQQPPPPPPPPYGPPPGQYASPQAGAPPNPFAPPGAYPPPPGPDAPYPYPPSGFQVPATNGLAITALILGLVGWLACGVGSIVAVILGFVARAQIRESQGRQGGDGLALAGIVLGFVAIGFIVLFIVLSVATGSNSGTS